MKQHHVIMLGLFLAFSFASNSQPIPVLTTTNSPQLVAQQQRNYSDSIQRKLMLDSLGLSNSVINQVLDARHNFDSLSRAIYQNASGSNSSQGLQVQALRRQTTEAIKELMGISVYDHYIRVIMGQ